jgi:PAS domain S-box-containing protein
MLSLHRRAMMNAVVENSFDGIVITDADGRIKESNAAADGLMGWEPGAARDGDVGAFIPNAESIREDFCSLRTASSDRAKAFPQPVEIEIARRDGTEFTMELVVTSSKMSMTSESVKNGKLDRVLYIYTFRDVTERRRAQEAQRKAMDEAVAANKMKSEFLANMSHELRTPLNAVLGFARIIQAETFGPIGVAEYEKYIGEINRSGEHLLDIINDILDMAKIETGKIELNERQFGLENVISSCLTLIRPRAEQGRVKVSLETHDALPGLFADERLVKQMLLNLLSNAVKFTPQGGSAVVRVRNREDGSLAVDVADTGIGIAEEDMQKILEPFGQVDGSLQRDFEGTGLGLPLVKSMIVEHGGEISIESTPGVGTTTTIVFPPDRVLEVAGETTNSEFGTGDECVPTATARPSEPCRDPRQDFPETPPVVDVGDASGLRVLVAEDNRVNQLIIKTMISAAGHRADIVANGREAVAAVRERSYDVVLMDIHMPELDGVEATREIRAGDGSERNIPIIAVTASAAPADRERFLRAGMNDHVAKPLDAESLFGTIKKHCDAPAPTGGQSARTSETSPGSGAATADANASALNELGLLLEESLKNAG